MAKNWIKKAIKHPGRCTPGSPNYDCPKGSPQWNLAQRFKHGDLHKKEDGGYVASDNIDIKGYTNPIKYFAEDGKNIHYELPIQYVPSESTGTKINPGQNNKEKVKGESKGLKGDSIGENIFEVFDPTGISSWDDVYREWNNGKFDLQDIVQPLTAIPILGKLGKLPQGIKMGQDIYKSGSLLKLLKGLNIEEAISDINEDNIKKIGGKIVNNDCLECGGRIKANKGANVPEKQIPTSEQVKAWNKAKHELKLQLQKEGKDVSYLDHNLDYAKTFLQGYNKQNNFIFGEDKSPEEIVKFWQEYNNDVYSDPTYKSSLLPFEQTYQKSVENNERNDSINPNNRSNPDGVLGSFTINDITPLRVLKKKGTDESGEAVIILNPYSPEKFTIEKNSIIKKNTPVNNEQLLQELYTVPNFGVQPGTSPSFQNGGIVKAWIQKFSNGGYIADEGFPGGQELTQPTTNYYNWGNYGNQNSFLTSDQINQKPFQNPYQNMNLQQPNVPQFNIPKGQEIEPLTSIGAQKMTPDLQGIRNRANQSMQDIAPKSKSPMNMNAVNMGLDIGTQSMSAAANLMGSLGKDNSKAQAFGQGASGAMNVASQVTAPFKDIPIAGKAIDAVGKTLGFFIGGALEARRQGIENEEMDKYNKLQEYTSRNTQTAQQPSYYGQYMSKYGSNIKNLEQRLVDDIFSDYDKFMKLT